MITINLDEIRIRKVDLQNTINELNRKIEPLTKELNELEQVEKGLEEKFEESV